ncbi:MAG: phosphoglycerate kinase [Dehalococcoidia bacterium]|nr:phosphoglycerate kinase [Dehalococcoidia bacterium]MCL2615218.1 phosphoglycerate kinase [Dehalococcoidia bacterium]
MDKKTVRDVSMSGKKVLTRVDFNVPLDVNSGNITDDSRIKAAVPTIDYLLDHNASLILCSHMGRPKGKVIPGLSLRGVAERLSSILRQSVSFVPVCIGPNVEARVAELKSGEILVLENLRFHPEEEQNDPLFSQTLAKLGDIYVDDAFGTAHRAHASIVGVTKFLPSVAGLLLEKEINSLGKVLLTPARPFGLLLGGAKISDKVALIENILPRVNYIIIGGGMAATFLKAKGHEVGQSLLDNAIDTASYLMQKAEANNVKVFLPEDVVIADVGRDDNWETVSIADMPANKRIVDIGALTVSNYTRILERCKTVFWNGPIGVYEVPQFAEGTRALARIISSVNATTIIGGGSTAEIVTGMNLNGRMTFVSTGGGAALKFLSGVTLPGVEALLDN